MSSLAEPAAVFFGFITLIYGISYVLDYFTKESDE